MSGSSLALNFAFLVGLALFLGFAYEDVFERAGLSRPGGVRTFPMLALLGAILYLLDPAHLVLVAAGLLLLGAWLLIYYWERIHAQAVAGRQDVGLMSLLLNVYAFVLGPLVLTQPRWIAVGTTVFAVLSLALKEPLHALARRIEIGELVTAAQFLILSGLVLPLLPDRPVTNLTNITPREAWLALVVVCALSYGAYLLQRYVPAAAGGLLTAALGGLYSSTAATVVLAAQARAQPASLRQARSGITLATAVMYLRILAVVAVFNFVLARALAPWLAALSLAAFAIAAAQYRFGRRSNEVETRMAPSRNPLELGPAALFALLFVSVSLVSTLVARYFGAGGIYALAAVVGVTDIDPFVLNLAQGGAGGLSVGSQISAILIAASSNDVLKAIYAGAFGGWRTSFQSAAALLLLAAAGAAMALSIGHA